MSDPYADIIYIHVELMEVDHVNNIVKLRGSWTGLPESFPDTLSQVPVYFNFQPNKFQVDNSAIQIATAFIGAKVENFFENYTYTLSIDTEEPRLLLNAFQIS
jgi:hypothetical protein